MKTFFTILTVLIFPFLLSSQVDKSKCKKRIKIKAIPFGQTKWLERTMEVYVNYKEISKEKIKEQNKADSARYAGWDFYKIDNPTNKMDCAGYTYNQMFLLTGQYWITAGVFYQNIILPFAKQISDRRTWGDAKPNDIVVFRNGGEAKHIAYIESVEKTLGVVTSITIITKDNKEGVFKHKLGLFLNGVREDNPLVQSLGYPYVYRVNYGNFDINESFYKDCEVPPLESANYVLKEVIVNDNFGYKDKIITPKELSITREIDNNKYTIKFNISEPPKEISSEETFAINASLESSEEKPVNYKGLVVTWYCGESYSYKNSADKFLNVGKYGDKVTKSITDNITVTVPNCTDKQIICTFMYTYGFSDESSAIEWVRYVYEKKN